MRLAGYAFRPRWWGFLLACAACALAIALGNWQWQRAETRRAAIAARDAAQRAPAFELSSAAADAAQLVHKRVAVRGEFVPGNTVLLQNRMHRGQAGYHVAQPLRIAQSGVHVLVLRGWIAADPRRERLPAPVTPAGEQRLEGIALEGLPQYFEPPGAASECRPGPSPCVWLNLTLEAFGAWSGLPLQPVLVEQTSDLADGLVREWERPEAGYRKNEMYALQWYSLAALSVALFVVLSVRRDQSDAR